FWDGLEARNEKKLDSLYDFGNYITVGSFDAAKDLYQGMEDRAHVAMNSPYDFVNYVSMGTLDLGNGAINPEESFSKEHWLSSIGLASILAGGAKPLVPKPKTPSLQDRNLVLEQTVNKAHELTMKTKADVNFVVDEVRGGINVFRNAIHNNDNLVYSTNVSVPKIPVKVMDTESVKKVLDRVWSKFSLSGVGKGTGTKLDDMPRINEIEVNFNYKTKFDSEEFAKQLRDQEKGMNELTVDEYLKNRQRYIDEGRAIEGNAAQQAAREKALNKKIEELFESGMSWGEAEEKANSWLKTQAALHNPDQIAGGNPLHIGGMGDKRINSSIGAQWKYRIDIVDEQIGELAKKMTPEQRKNTYLNVKLTQ
ncbi:hypothetical protein K9V48_27595, partial [Metabacillus sp. DBTR6]|nr:hypothetical protein [Metabacillus rhizolycopersici]